MTTRRDFLEKTALAAVGLALPVPKGLGTPPRGFLDVVRAPDGILVQTATGDVVLTSQGNGRWTNGAISVDTVQSRDALKVSLTSPGTPVKRIRLRWRGSMIDTRLILGDAWERGYGDL